MKKGLLSEINRMRELAGLEVMNEDSATNLELKSVAKGIYTTLKQQGLTVDLSYTNVKDGAPSFHLDKQQGGSSLWQQGKATQYKGQFGGSYDARVVWDDKNSRLALYFRAIQNVQEMNFVESAVNSIKAYIDKNYSNVMEFVGFNETKNIIAKMKEAVKSGPQYNSYPYLLLIPKKAKQKDQNDPNNMFMGLKISGSKGVIPPQPGTYFYLDVTKGFHKSENWRGDAPILRVQSKDVWYDDVHNVLVNAPELRKKIDQIGQAFAKKYNLQYKWNPDRTNLENNAKKQAAE